MDRSRTTRDAQVGGGLLDDPADVGFTDAVNDDHVVRSDTEPTIAPTPAASVGLPSLPVEPGSPPDLSSAGKQRVARPAPLEHGDGSQPENRAGRDAGIEQRTYPQRRVLRAAADAVGQAVSEEDIIDIPVHGENVETHKRIRVGEEVEIAKEGVQRTRQVAATVRQERVRIDEGTHRLADEPSGRDQGDRP
jgi:hypothetical protein